MLPDGVSAARYSLDTSALLNTWRKFYPPDVFPSLWQRVEELADSGTLVASEEVLVELERKDDEVYAWAKERAQMFVPIDAQVQQVVRRVLRDYPRLLDTRRSRSGADPFVIALADILGCAVVTYETRSNNASRPRIPDVCDAMGVRCVSFLDFIREQGWRI